MMLGEDQKRMALLSKQPLKRKKSMKKTWYYLLERSSLSTEDYLQGKENQAIKRKRREWF